MFVYKYVCYKIRTHIFVYIVYFNVANYYKYMYIYFTFLAHHSYSLYSIITVLYSPHGTYTFRVLIIWHFYFSCTYIYFLHSIITFLIQCHELSRYILYAALLHSFTPHMASHIYYMYISHGSLYPHTTHNVMYSLINVLMFISLSALHLMFPGRPDSGSPLRWFSVGFPTIQIGVTCHWEDLWQC